MGPLTLYALAVPAGLVLLQQAERRAAGEQARTQPKHPVQAGSYGANTQWPRPRRPTGAVITAVFAHLERDLNS
jgi:hypothetical protein